MAVATSNLKKVTIFTDGACINSPGPGGYAAVLLYNGKRKELSGGFRLTTNNRMAAKNSRRRARIPISLISTKICAGREDFFEDSDHATLLTNKSGFALRHARRA